MIPVIVESPYASETPEGIERNVAYARAAMHDCLRRDESPYASHLLYTQPGVLDDTKPDERKLGIEAGFVWRQLATLTVVYVDLGITKGMWLGLLDADKRGQMIVFRSLDHEHGLARISEAIQQWSAKLAEHRTSKT